MTEMVEVARKQSQDAVVTGRVLDELAAVTCSNIRNVTDGHVHVFDLGKCHAFLSQCREYQRTRAAMMFYSRVIRQAAVNE